MVAISNINMTLRMYLVLICEGSITADPEQYMHDLCV